MPKCSVQTRSARKKSFRVQGLGEQRGDGGNLVDGSVSLPLGGGSSLGCFGRCRSRLAFLLLGSGFVTRHRCIGVSYSCNCTAVVQRRRGVELHRCVRVGTGNVAASESLQPLPFYSSDSIIIISSSITVICKESGSCQHAPCVGRADAHL